MFMTSHAEDSRTGSAPRPKHEVCITLTQNLVADRVVRETTSVACSVNVPLRTTCAR